MRISAFVMKLSVALFFANLSAGKPADAFANAKWWAPGGVLLPFDKERVMRRMQASSTDFVVKDVVVGDSCLAARVEFNRTMFQFLFLFQGGKIVGVKENTDDVPLIATFKRKTSRTTEATTE